MAALVVAGAVATVAIAWRPGVAAVDPPAPETFDQALVKRGRDLVATGNCSTCHTRRGGKAFAGGRAVPTPFGTIYSSNITPDAETGIGRWPEAAFRRAMRAGVDRAGRHLYPTFPYYHFTHVSDDDDHALYAYLMTRAPVQEQAPENQLPFPLDRRVFAGGEADNWIAYAINAQSTAPVPWDAEALFAYLRNGWHPDHGVARGPMAEVVSNLSGIPDSDVRAIAIYMAGVFGPATPGRKRRGEELIAQLKSTSAPAIQANGAGAAIYAAACANCHETARPLPYGGVNLALSTALSAPDARNASNIVLLGIRPVEGEPSPIMLGFAASMSNAQIAELLEYLRIRFSNQPAWVGVEKVVADARRSQTVFLQTSSPSDTAPTDSGQRGKP